MKIKKVVINHYQVKEDTAGSLEDYRGTLTEAFPEMEYRIRNASDSVINLYKALEDLSERDQIDFINMLIACY